MSDQPLKHSTILFLQMLQAMREEGLPITNDSLDMANLIYDGLDLLEPVGDDDEEKAELAAFLALGFDIVRQDLERAQHLQEQV